MAVQFRRHSAFTPGLAGLVGVDAFRLPSQALGLVLAVALLLTPAYGRDVVVRFRSFLDRRLGDRLDVWDLSLT